ncbi:acetate kinase [Arenibacter sp. GZD96]|uniref:acetate/propionate family kinase n=1 Tax=Aurantibrevibacter litoralis TaxID=3106030 RepID=UPI002AFEC509|nr:acetate kinase [Arenibacter sp. GZD-96]MEA1785677.1 acetate kinase [Arenibacter sp. GZD-96]
MNVLIINAGSSSIKFMVIAMPSENLRAKGIIERIGEKDAIVHYKTDTADIKEVQHIPDHKVGLQRIAGFLLDAMHGIIKNAAEIDVVGHRVVHGGTTFSNSTLIDVAVKQKIHELSALAPLHNPHNLEGIILAEQVFPKAHQVAVFDTAFHQTIPEKAKKYAIPNEFYKDHGIQLYGFHGTSHKYVSEQARAYLQKKASKIITVHLGNGCSITAVANGQSVDHSLGFTPSNGLIMGSRSGDIDHAIIFYLVHTLGYSLEEVNTLLIKKSGMLGLTGYADLREIQTHAANGDDVCRLALEMNAYRVKKYIGAYVAVLNGLDALIFTAGIGENSSVLRAMICRDMDYLGIILDEGKNREPHKTLREINATDARVKILVVPTNEELEIAKQAFGLLS